MLWPARYPLPSTLILVAVTTYLGFEVLFVDAEIVTLAEASSTSDVEIDLVTGPELKPIDLKVFSTTLARPIFNPERVPTKSTPEPVVAVKAEPTVVQKPDARVILLSGIMSQADGTVSVFLTGTSDSRWVRVGDDFEGWTVVEANRDGVVLEHDGHVAEKTMYAQ